MAIPEIDPTDPGVLLDPFTAYSAAREQGRLARMQVPGLGTLWIATRHEDAREVLGGGRFGLSEESFMRPPGIPEHCLRYLRTMAEMEGPEHLRLRTLAAPAFTASRARAFRPRIERIVTDLLDALPSGEIDLLEHFARPLPMEVISELVGIPAEDRPRWREYGTAVVGGFGPAFQDAIPAIIEGARAAVARRKEDPGDDLISTLLQVRADDGDRLTDDELVTLVWHLVLAGQTPTNLIGNAVEVLLTHPEHLATLRADPSLMPRAVEELTRLAGPQLLTTPRFAKEDVTFDGVTIRKGDRVSAAIVAANRDPRVYGDPDTLDLTRTAANHLGYAHGPHFCLGAAFARAETEVALTALVTRYPDLALAGTPERTPDGGTWRLSTLPVTR
ncbi:MAG: cytochrome P450 [Saccharothrix sp.]|nr:cytochrome P450 [Saccharothrix sp.]